MTGLVLVLLAVVALVPLLLVPLRRLVADPVVPVAAVAATVLALAAALAARLDPVHGWRLGVGLVLGVLVATFAGSPVVRSVFRLMRGEFLPVRAGRRGPSGPAPSPEASRPDEAVEAVEAVDAISAERPETVLRGGAWIGCLERAGISATLLAGWPEGVALVLAVKGVGRYAELRQTNAPEAFIVGTLASVLWASAAAGAAHLLR